MKPIPRIPEALRAALASHTKALTTRGIARFQRLTLAVPEGWVYHRGTFSRRHDRDLRVLATIEDDAADADLFDAIPPELLAQLREAMGASAGPRSAPRPPTYHLSLSRSSRPVSRDDVLRATLALVPAVTSWEGLDGPFSAAPPGASERQFVHLFAPVASRGDLN